MEKGKMKAKILSIIVALLCTLAIYNTVSAGIKNDVKEYAKEYGLSLKDAKKLMKVQDKLGDIEAIISQQVGFAGLFVEHVPFRVIVQAVNPYFDVSLIVKMLDVYFGNHDILEVRIVEHSMNKLIAIQYKISNSAKIKGLKIDTDIDVMKNQVIVYTTQANKIKDILSIPDSVKIVPVSHLLKTEARSIYGGLWLYSFSDVCTSGFSVKKGSTRGITTAGHCPNFLAWRGYPLTFRGQLVGGSLDAQWHTSKFKAVNLIQIKSGVRKIYSTKSRSSQVLKHYVCKSGVATGYTCGHIYSKNYNGTFIRVNNSAMYTNLSDSGDSGAPWFYNNTAYGTHVGSPSDDNNDAIYMAVDFIEALGVKVLTY